MTITPTRPAGPQADAELAAAGAAPERPQAHAAIAAAIASQGFTADVADRLAADAVRVLLPLLDDVDEHQGPANYDEDNYPAGWHGAVDDLRVLLVGDR